MQISRHHFGFCPDLVTSNRNQALHILSPGTSGRCSTRVLSRIYTAGVRPILMDGHTLFIGANLKHFEPLFRIERRALRIIHRTPIKISN